MDGAIRIRQSLLLRGRRRHGDVTDGPRQLVGNEASSRLSPGSGRQLEIALPGPIRHDKNDLSQSVGETLPLNSAS